MPKCNAFNLLVSACPVSGVTMKYPASLVAGEGLCDKTDLSHPETLEQLAACLLYACVTDDTDSLAVKLGLPTSLSAKEALSLWILNETKGIKFIDAGALFNYLAKQLDAILDQQRGNRP